MQELIDAVRAMRQAQKAYFADRTHARLIASKNAEKTVDKLLDRLDRKANSDLPAIQFEGWEPAFGFDAEEPDIDAGTYSED